jgi:hypothetical protein
VLQGRGGDKDLLDSKNGSAAIGPNNQPFPQDSPCDPTIKYDPRCGREVGFNYGYVEAELHFGRYVGVITRLLAGQTVDGNGVGAELRLRIGPEMGTNLVAGGSILRDIGALGLLQLETHVSQTWPMSLAVMVTNQPAEENIGVRIVYQIAYRARSWIQPALRVGYNVRDKDHGGLSVGLGLIMGW